MGSNMAENHPVGFQWVIEARERGAHVIHVDPRFSRTSAMATIWAPLRAGSDILFLGGLINYVLDRGKEFREYVVHYTNASAILPDDVQDSEGLGGLFSGWDREERQIRPEHVVLSAEAGRRQAAAVGWRADLGWPHEGQRETGCGCCRLRPGSDTRTSPVCVPGLETALCPVHPRDGRAVLRRAEGAVPRDC